MMKRLITAKDIEEIRKSRGTLIVSKDVIYTPSAKDLIKEYGISVVEEKKDSPRRVLDAGVMPDIISQIYFACDPSSEPFLNKMMIFWKKIGYAMKDLGRASDEISFKNLVAQIPKDMQVMVYIAENGFRETAWFNKYASFSAVRCTGILEVQEALKEMDAKILVIGSELMGWKSALRTSYEFIQQRQKIVNY